MRGDPVKGGCGGATFRPPRPRGPSVFRGPDDPDTGNANAGAHDRSGVD